MCIFRSPKSDFGVSSNTALNHCLILLHRLLIAGGDVVKQMTVQAHLIVVVVTTNIERSCSDTNGKQYSLVETLNVMEGIKIWHVLSINLIT
jgi:hypothetical protein